LDLKQDVLRLSWHMRGGVSYNDALNMSFEERKLIANLAKENFETTEKTQLPYF